MKYLVVGGGSIGLNICRQLIEYGHHVDLVSKRYYKKNNFILVFKY